MGLATKQTPDSLSEGIYKVEAEPGSCVATRRGQLRVSAFRGHSMPSSRGSQQLFRLYENENKDVVDQSRLSQNQMNYCRLAAMEQRTYETGLATRLNAP
jgi:hypothetical protein